MPARSWFRGPVVAISVLLISAALWYNAKIYQWRAYTPVVRTFLATALRADTAALVRAAVDSQPVNRTLATPTSVLEQLQSSLRVSSAARTADTVLIQYSTRVRVCPYNDGSFDPYQVRLVRRGNEWLVAFAGFGPC